MFVPVSGGVKYRGEPVKRGTINFVPMATNGVAATGDVVDGKIKNVTTHTQGDGAKVGKYRVTIIAFDEAYVEGVAKRGPNGPDPQAVTELAANAKPLIPGRYGNAKDSGLTAEVTASANDFHYDLSD